MHDWITLTTVFGESVESPSELDMRAALKELFSSVDDEHPDAWIECGTEDGPLYSISIYSSGYAIYTKYSDADMTEELETKEIENVDASIAFELWSKLAAGTGLAD